MFHALHWQFCLHCSDWVRSNCNAAFGRLQVTTIVSENRINITTAYLRKLKRKLALQCVKGLPASLPFYACCQLHGILGGLQGMAALLQYLILPSRRR